MYKRQVLDPEESLSIIGNFLIKQKEKNPNTLIISVGDMFQGTAISNITRGDLVVEVMNYIGFCLLYTSDAADDLHCVDLCCRRIIKKKKNTNNSKSLPSPT
mgnify:CR=1 FL=1